MDSPCIGVCTITMDDRVCVGCGRTTNEIRNWPSLPPLEQWIINDKAKERLRVRGHQDRERPR